MAYLIDETYFQRELYVPNADELNSGALNELTEFIDDKARLCLKYALGYELFNDLDSNITDGVLDVGAPAKWLNLVNGVEYTKDGETFKWDGLISTEGAFKKSLLANFTFYYWLEYNQSKMSGVGEVVVNAKNAINVNSTQRLVKVWNEFVSMYQGSDYNSYYGIPQPSIYYKGNIRVTDWLGNCYNDNFVSFIQFLYDNDNDYPDATLKRYNKQNQLGI